MGFIEIEELYKRARLVICRAGSTTLSELIENEIPMIVKPFKQSADNHQQINAEYIEENGMGVVIQEPEELEKAISILVNNYYNIKLNLKNNKKSNAAERIADYIINEMDI